MNFEMEQSAEIFRVLVVDDDQMLNMLICSYLETENFITTSAYSLQEAKNIINNGELIDLILLDYQLGDGEGIDLLKYNDEFPFIEKSPVIMVSANDKVEFLENCFSCGASDYIIKPINFKLLSLKSKNLIRSVKYKNIINVQYQKLSEYKSNAEREEGIAKFTYEYLVRRANKEVEGVSIWQRSLSAFSGDIVLAKISPAGDLFVILADATGHGLSAAITVMPMIYTFNSMISKGFHLQLIVAEINRKLVSDTPDDRFVAAIALEISKTKGKMAVWSGGMPPVYVVNNGKVTHEFKSRHLALGILDDASFEASVEELDITAQETIFMCSDGLLEQDNVHGQAYAKELLISALLCSENKLIESVVDDFTQYVGDEGYTDDVCVCAIDIAKVFSENQESEDFASQSIERSEGKCVFTLRVSGARLARNEIIPLVQSFSQQMDLQQSVRQKIFVVVSEMVTNAVDHGVLGLSSEIKEMDNGFIEYHNEREKRLASIGHDGYIELTICCEDKLDNYELTIKVKDSGKGYDEYLKSASGELLNSGRGLTLVRTLSKVVKIDPPGNVIEVILS